MFYGFNVLCMYFVYMRDVINDNIFAILAAQQHHTRQVGYLN